MNRDEVLLQARHLHFLDLRYGEDMNFQGALLLANAMTCRLKDARLLNCYSEVFDVLFPHLMLKRAMRPHY